MVAGSNPATPIPVFGGNKQENGKHVVRNLPADRMTAIAAAILAIAIAVGAGMRAIALDRIPLGFQQDEACNGYDAYSLITTAHDHHGNFLPLAIQGFNDYRMPLFDYSLAPLIGTFGLKPWVVRMGAAIWGIADLIAIALIATELIDPIAAAAAVILLVLSPWHLAMSRFGVETISASTTISWAIAFFLLALKRHDGRYLAACALLFGISLYSYSITKPVTPLVLAWLAFLYRRDLRPMARWAAGAAAIFVVVAIPQLWMIATHGDAMQAHFRQISAISGPDGLATFAINWLTHFTPGFLFGDNGWPIVHAGNLIPFLPGEALLAIAGLIGLLAQATRRAAMLLIGWIAVTAIPGSTIRPAPEPQALHDFLMVAPFALLAALGASILIRTPFQDLNSAPIRIASTAIAAAAMVFAMIEGISSARYYFTKFPDEHAALFQYGLDELIHTAQRLAPPDYPIILPLSFNEPYIYALFFNAYPPERFYSNEIAAERGLFGQVFAFDRYGFTANPWKAYNQLPHGVFIFPKAVVRLKNPMQAFSAAADTGYSFPDPPAPPAATLRFGREVYSIVVK
ncbi:MAG TPA: glycosyltransferase family 39 protein [Candidatus Binataceae bacterium]|nr:glycosyltransferase family 39 protein [Candidatus Binataceae bacterium]